MEPRGVRNNNPGNIEYGPFARAHGATGSDGRFAIFPTPEAGIQAIVALQGVYENKHGLESVSERIGRWAPAGENNTNAYAEAVAKAMGIDPDQPFSMSDPQMAQAFITAMIQHENGKQPYSQEQIARAYAQGPTATGAQRAAGDMASGQGVRGDPDVFQLQQVLSKAGFDPGPLDGIMGPRTQAAMDAYTKAEGQTQQPPGTPRNIVMGPSAATRFPANIVPRSPSNIPPAMQRALGWEQSAKSYARPVAGPAASPPGPGGPAPIAPVIPEWAQALAGKTGMEPGFRSVAAAQPGPSGGPRFDYITGMAPRPSMGLPGFMGRAFAPDTVAGKAMGALGRGLGNLGIQMPSAGQGGGLMGAFAGPGPSVPTTAYQAPGGTVWSWANPVSNQGGGEFQGPTSFNSSGGGGLGAFLGSIFGGR